MLKKRPIISKKKFQWPLVISIIAVLISLGSVFVSLMSLSITSSYKTLIFWKQLNTSYQAQQKLASGIYAELRQKTYRAQLVLNNIHGNKLSCIALTNIDQNRAKTNSKTYDILPKSYSQGDTMRLITSERMTILGLNSLAKSLHIGGWDQFKQQSVRSEAWWSKLAWKNMQIEFMPAYWGFECSPNHKQINVTQRSQKLFSNDIKQLRSDSLHILMGNSPNVYAIASLESSNMPYAS